MIGIIDYGAGNLHSVKKALDFLRLPSRIVHSPDEATGTDRLILPGVGHFQSAVLDLRASGLYDTIASWLAECRPFLGICLGMQLLFAASDEAADGCPGFGVFPGRVRRFSGRKTLHMGWNRIRIHSPSPLFTGLEANPHFYFVHRYFTPSAEPSCVTALSDFDEEFVAAVQKGAVYGVQFHPEKSGASGLKLLANWGKSC